MIVDELRTIAADLLKSGAVDLFIGYGENESGQVVPVFISSAEEAGRLVWNEVCVYNLVRYLTDRHVSSPREKAVGVAVKGCDLKSLRVLLSEKQVLPGNVKAVGIACEGINGPDGARLTKCEVCAVKTPDSELCEAVLGAVEDSPPAADDFRDVEALEQIAADEKRALWERYFERCIRCYACRNICPLCYCKECVMDQRDPEWVQAAPSVQGNRAFNIVRAYHLAGRCVDCGECERACPVGIPIRTVNRKMAKTVKEGFGFEAGIEEEKKSPITWFKPDDPNDFIK